MSSRLPLILLSGLGADPRLFEAQRRALPDLITPAWIPSERNETLASYARRLAQQNDPGGPCLVGGCSLGGMLAQEMAPHLSARACLLISSVRGPEELPRRYRILRPAARLVTQPLRGLPWASRQVLSWGGGLLTPIQQGLVRQCADNEGRFLQWAAWAVLGWKGRRDLRIPVVQIHGTRDHVLPHRLTQPDVLIAGGGHVLPVTHPQEVNAFLQAQSERWGSDTPQR